MMTADERRERDRLYKRQYYRAHKEQIAEYRRQYAAKHPEKRNAEWNRYYAANAQRINGYYRARRERLRRVTPFGAFLKQRGISQWYAAEKLGVSVSTVSNWANGITVPKESKILAVWPEYGGEI